MDGISQQAIQERRKRNIMKNFKYGDCVLIQSKSSNRRGDIAIFLYYCNGKHDNICRVRFEDGNIRNYAETSLEQVNPT